MVKRDLRLWFLIWLRRISIPALCILALYQYYQLYFDFGSLSLSNRILDIIGYPFIVFFVGWGLPWPSHVWQEAERARRGLSQVRLHQQQPGSIGPVSLPLVLRRGISRSGYLFLGIVWSGLVIGFTGISLLFLLPLTLDKFMTALFVIGILLACGFLLIVFLSMVFYQRIAADEHGLLVQKGLIRKQIHWDQARLFAYGSYEKTPKQVEWVELSGPQTLLRWNRIYGSKLLYFSSVPDDNYVQQLSLMESTIHLKTGLPLRDLRFSGQ